MLLLLPLLLPYCPLLVLQLLPLDSAPPPILALGRCGQASPPCTTFTTLEYANGSHRSPDGSPLTGVSGDLARTHDLMIERLCEDLESLTSY